jgi:hypothetical protein
MESRSTEPEKFSQFLEKIWERKIWVLTTALFLAAGGFVIRVYSLWPTQFAEHRRILIEDEYSLDEARRIPQISRLIDGVTDDFSAFLDFYGEKLVDEVNKSPSNDAVYREALDKLSQLEKKLNSAQGFLDGQTFADDARKDFLNSHREILVRYQALTSGYKSLVETRRSGVINEAVPPTEQELLNKIHSTAAFVSSTSQSFARLNKDLDLITNREQEMVQIVRWEKAQLYLTAPMDLYMVLWIIFAIRAYLRGRE